VCPEFSEHPALKVKDFLLISKQFDKYPFVVRKKRAGIV